MTDPFRPAAAVARFPRERLLRVGLDEATVGNLVERFDAMSPEQRSDLVRFVDGHTDQAIAERYAGGVDATQAPTREQLDELHVPELRDRLAARGQPVSGVKAELIDRLLASYEQQPEQPEGAQVTGTALTGDAEQPQQPAEVELPDGERVTGELPTSAATSTPEQPAPAPAEPAPAPTPAPTPAEGAAAPQPAPEPAAAPVEQPAAPATPPATLPVGSPGAPAATDESTATPTPAAPAGGSTTPTTGGTA